MDITITVKDTHLLPLREEETLTEFWQRQADAMVAREDDRDLQKQLARVPDAAIRTVIAPEVAKVEAAEEAARLEA
jgi:hypothetical protein